MRGMFSGNFSGNLPGGPQYFHIIGNKEPVKMPRPVRCGHRYPPSCPALRLIDAGVDDSSDLNRSGQAQSFSVKLRGVRDGMLKHLEKEIVLKSSYGSFRIDIPAYEVEFCELPEE